MSSLFQVFTSLLLWFQPQAYAAGPIQYQLVTNASLGASYTSPSIDMLYKEWGSIQAEWTGASAAGTLALAVSNDNVNFSTYTGSSTTVAGPGNFMWNMLFVGFRYVEIVFTYSSGTGTLNATTVGKGS